jgi:hypothetical protein
MDRSRCISSFIALTFVALTVLGASPALSAQKERKVNACRLKSDHGDVQHVIYLIFDNVHFLRDNANVPSDLEQMPNLLNFIRSKGGRYSQIITRSSFRIRQTGS